jgi:hypothetical protein
VCDKDVAGLDVTVQYSGAVCGFERVEQGDTDGGQVLRRRRAAIKRADRSTAMDE